MRRNALILFAIIIKDFQFFHPVHHGHKTNNGKNPVDTVGGPPTVHKSPRVVEILEEYVYEKVLNAVKKLAHVGYIYFAKIVKP